jgi:Septum formation
MVALIAMLGGCAATAGDKNIIDDWAVMPEAKAKVPPVGACYASATTDAEEVDASFSKPIECTQSHAVETFHVGQFPSDVAAIPTLGKAEYARAFEECEVKAREFLGSDWFNGRLYMNIVVPVTRQWDGGARWFRCELIETQNMYSATVVTRTSSLTGGLRGDAPLALRCGNIVGKKADNSWDDLTPVDCAQPHDAEYAGSFKARDGLDEPTAGEWDGIYDRCWDTVASFLGGTRSGIQVGYLVWNTAKERWQMGDHWVRCYAWGDDRRMVGSVKGIGNAAPRSG